MNRTRHRLRNVTERKMMRRHAVWVVGSINGKTTFYGPYNTEDAANNAGNQVSDWDNGNFDLFPCDTSNMAMAKSMWKAKRAGETHSLGLAMRKVYDGNKRLNKEDDNKPYRYEV
jgi:hypothetical protein